jgi:hypothetical protein
LLARRLIDRFNGGVETALPMPDLQLLGEARTCQIEPSFCCQMASPESGAATRHQIDHQIVGMQWYTAARHETATSQKFW